MANNFNDLNEYVDTLCALPSSLYDDKVNVNEVDTNLISTHVTAEDLNNLKSAITTISENVNKINQHLISTVVDDIQIPGAFSVNGSINQSLNQYLANDYIRKNQLIVDDHLVNDSIEKLDDIYLRSKNIFVDGYKISTTSPYNLVSFSQLNLLVNDLSSSFLNNTLNDIKKDINNYISNLNLNGYTNGKYITISGDNKSINCTLSGDGTFIDIDQSGKIYIVPSGNESTYVLKSVSGKIQWGTIETGSTVTNGQYITIGNSGDINCTLTEGNYTRISSSPNDGGKYPIDVTEASIDNKGVVQLVDKITTSNHTRNDIAISPAALIGLVGIEEHILGGQGVRDADPAANEPQGMKTGQTAGWIKYPSLRSTAYPDLCLAEAWGWTAPKFISAGYLNIPITKMQDGLGVQGSYCMFHRIIYVDLDTISIGSDGHADINYELAFGPPTEDGTDIKGFSLIHTHVINHYSNSASGFQVFWKVKGYVKADYDEIWGVTPPESAELIISFSPTPITQTATKDLTTYFDNTVCNDACSVPIGYLSAYATAQTATTTVTWTLKRLEKEYSGITPGYYKFNNLRTWVYGHLDTGYAAAIAYADFSNAKIDFTTGTITNVIILRSRSRYNTGWTKDEIINTLYFNPNTTSEQWLYFSPTMNDSTRLRDWQDQETPHSNSGRTLFHITVNQYTAEIKIQGQGYYQHNSTADAHLWHTPIEDATAQFVPTI